MARTTKKGIDYFSHDVDLSQNKKIRILKAKFGLVGYAVYLILLENIYKNGYYLQLDEDFNILFADDNNIDFNVYINILNVCINKNLFDDNLHKKYNILTSDRIQENYFAAIGRRKEIKLIENYILTDIPENINVSILSLNVDINSLNDNNGTQSKVKESKEKVKEKKRKNKSTLTKTTYTEEYEKLYELYPRTGNKKQGFKNYTTRLKEFTYDELYKSVINYKKQMIIEKRSPKFMTIISNFFGEKAIFEEYLKENSISEDFSESKPERFTIDDVITYADMGIPEDF